MDLTYDIFANDLVKRFDDRITGSSLDKNINMTQKKEIMIGMLGAERIQQKFGDNDNEYVVNTEKQYENLPSINLTFLTNKDVGSFNIGINGDFYYRVIPNYDEQVNELIDSFNLKNKTEFSTIPDIQKYMEDQKLADDKYSLLDIYNKLNYSSNVDELCINKNDFYNGYSIEFDKTINNDLMEIINQCCDRSIQIVQNKKRFSISDVVDCEKFNDFLAASTKKIEPKWKLKLLVTVKEFDSEKWQVDIMLYNATTKLEQIKNAYDENFYNAKVKITGLNGAKFENIQTGYLKKTYKKQPITKALSSNAAVLFNSAENSIETNCLPTYYQHRVKTNDKYNDNITFNNMVNNPVENLNIIYKDMLKDFHKARDRFNDLKTRGLLQGFEIDKYSDDLITYEQEIERFRVGIHCVEHIHYASKSFILMNKTMMTKMYDEQKVYPGWRLFQIVFIVSLIPDVIKQEIKDDPELDFANLKLVDLLYFSTGGGKTEAFLGITTFTLFFDRLRGKNIGTTSIIKYPLRLLSVQQLDRCLSILAKANKVLIDNCGNQYNDFTVGYLVGEGNTPNRIDSDKYDSICNSTQEELNEIYRMVDVCPFCGEKHINISFDKEKWVLKHTCKSCGKELPLYCIDDEIYRFLPSVLISTIDKLASIGIQRKYKSIFGGITHYCEKHGYSIDNECNVGGSKLPCSLENIEDELYDPIPSLIIQDELHLVRESLGTFSSHYETFLQVYCEKLVPTKHRKILKYIGATATISSYEDHINNLYGLNSRRFPCVYPSIENGRDFYSYESKELSRIIQGYSPYGVSVTDSIQVSNTVFRKILNEITIHLDEEVKQWNELGYEISPSDLMDMVLNYWISIIYTNSKRELQDLEGLFSNQGNNMLSSLNIPEYVIAKISGDEDFKNIKEVLNSVASDKDKRNTKNLVLSTSSISHGVDEDSFNQMFFFGLPSNTAEYIQAYSRVGRKYVEIVMDVFRLVRERDRSYLKYFNLFHENKDLTIDPVPIDRWARNAIYYTLPGLFNALLLQYYEVQNGIAYNKIRNVRELLSSIDTDEIKDILLQCYCGDTNSIKSKFYEKVISSEVDNIVEGIVNSSGGQGYVSKHIANYSYNHLAPMISLRDYEDGIEIKAE